MDNSIVSIGSYLKGNPYVGRGILVGTSMDGNTTSICYFIMGRSSNSRNRVFVKQGNDLMIKAYDESKVEDPSLIIYYPLRETDEGIVVTNGDQTDTIANHIKNGETFEDALRTRTFEPDAPNWTPRISAMVYPGRNYGYTMSILKSMDSEGSRCTRHFFEYESLPGTGHFIHTYVTDGDPLPTFRGEPVPVTVDCGPEDLFREIWENLDPHNRISCYLRSIDHSTGDSVDHLINARTEE